MILCLFCKVMWEYRHAFEDEAIYVCANNEQYMYEQDKSSHVESQLPFSDRK